MRFKNAVFCMSLLICAVISRQVAFGDSGAADEARKLFEAAEQREAAILKGFKWRWTVQSGLANSREYAIKGVFDTMQPGESFDCRWLSNHGAFLCESIAKQESRVVGATTTGKTEATRGTERYLVTPKSRLLQEPHPLRKWTGIVETQARGFSNGWPSPALPLHGGAIGLGRIKTLLARLDSKNSEVELSDGTTVNQEPARIVSIKDIKDQSGGRSLYYFRKSDLLLVQVDFLYQVWDSGHIVVTDTQVVTQGDLKLVIPKVAVYYSLRQKTGDWYASIISSKEAIWEPATDSEISVENHAEAIYALNPRGSMQKSGSSDRLTAANLDEFAESLYVNQKRSNEQIEKGNKARRDFNNLGRHVPFILVLIIRAYLLPLSL